MSVYKPFHSEKLEALLQSDIQTLGFLINEAEKADCFSDMVEFVKKKVAAKKREAQALASDGKRPYVELSKPERNELSIAYKNLVGARRGSWRSATSTDYPDLNQNLRDAYIKNLEKELEETCREVLDMMENTLLVSEKDIELMMAKTETLSEADAKRLKDKRLETIFYLKTCGDYYRYLAEFQPTNRKVKDSGNKAYTRALAIAEESVAPTDPIRLGLILNASVFKFEILKDPSAATDLAKKGFDNAIQKLDQLNDDTYKDSTLIMQLLRDNLTIWTEDTDDQPED